LWQRGHHPEAATARGRHHARGRAAEHSMAATSGLQTAIQSVGVLDTGVSRSTCYWAPSLAHLQLKEGSTTQATEKTLTRRRLVRRTTTETAKDQKTSSRALLVRREGTPTSAQHVCVQSKRTTGRRPRTSHATPDREETNFRCACLKRHSGCWPPP
jgi:hypothetical protein